MTDFSHDVFRFSVPLQIRFHDLDAFGHVNNARYLNYLEQGRMGYFREVIGWDGTLSGLRVIVAHVSVDYKVPIYLDTRVRLYTRVARLGNKSFDYEYAFVIERDGEETLSATAKTTMVTFDYALNQSVPVFADWRAAIQAYEKQ
ncbi:MAG: acyl-CoA thioesterase [Phototrophicaceae bacterium]|jgi:acyl-CoA thioester hydrolase